MRQTILVTGAAGFIGSKLAEHLIQDGYDVVAVDNLSTGFTNNVPPGSEFVLGDISEDETINNIPDRDYMACCHLAGQSSGEISFEDPGRDLKTNALGTLNMLEWCRKQGVGKFVFASSMSVYGDKPFYVPVAESDDCTPKSFYGISKLTSEHLLRVYRSEFGLNFTTLRLFNVYGPGQNLTNLKQGMVSIYLKYLLDGDRIIVKGSLDRYRDFIYVDDVVRIFSLALQDKNFEEEVLNVGTGVMTTVSSLLEKLCNCFGINEFQRVVDIEEGTPGDQFGIFSSTKHLRELTGHLSVTPLEVGIQRMVDWAREQKG